jgi:hypothetical protein
MKNINPKISWFGIALILVGGVLLLDRFHVLHLAFSTVFWPIIMILTLVGVGRGFAQNRSGKIFWNTVWFLYALFFFLRNSDFVELRSHMLMPATFLILGIAFLMTYFNNVRDWFFLIPALLFGVLGTLLILADLEYVSYWEVTDAVRLYWPIGLILFGVAMLLRRRSHNNAQTSAS